MNETRTDTPRIYVASLSDYNAGRLHGRWIDADQDAESIAAEVQEMLKASPEAIAEEWAIHDYDGFYGVSLSEYESFETVAEIGQAISEHGAAYAAYVDNVGAEYATVDGFEESYRGEYESRRHFAEDLADETGMLGNVPDEIASYFDWDAWTRDLFMGDCYSVDAPDGGVFIFWNN